MKCDKCGEILDFNVIRVKHFLETGETKLPVWLVYKFSPPKIDDPTLIRQIDIVGISLNKDEAQRILDMFEHLYEWQFISEVRPKLYLEKTILDHPCAFTMLSEEKKPPNYKDDELEIFTNRKWNDEIGKVDISHGITYEIVVKMLLKYGEIKKTFHLYDFIQEFGLPEELVKKAMGRLVELGMIRFVKHNKTK